MSKCAFELSQRVVLPADSILGGNVQAIVVDRKEFVGREPQYGLQYLVPGFMEDSGQLSVGVASYTESYLVEAQPVRPGLLITKVEAMDMARIAEQCGRELGREAAMRERRRRKARKSASRKRR